MLAITTDEQVTALKAENLQLKRALLLAVPWIGECPDGPEWATPDAKARNRAMCEETFDAAAACFSDACPLVGQSSVQAGSRNELEDLEPDRRV